MSENVTLTIGGADLSAYVVDAEIPIEGNAEGNAMPRRAQRDDHVYVWRRYLLHQAWRREDPSNADVTARIIRKAERAHARLARAPKRDWWGRRMETDR